MTYEGIRLRILKIKRKLFANIRQQKINKKDFTIISNNCWGGMIYESYNLPKQSPTVGMYFFADDYIKFVKDLKNNLEKELIFIKPEDSKWFEEIKNNKKIGTYPIGKIDDIEIFFLHYKDEKEADEKWKRRTKRINWDNLIIKFNDQNRCNYKNVRDFYDLDYKNKIFFTAKDWNIEEKYIKINQPFEKEFIKASYEPFGASKYIDINQYINNIEGEINEKRQ